MLEFAGINTRTNTDHSMFLLFLMWTLIIKSSQMLQSQFFFFLHALLTVAVIKVLVQEHPLRAPRCMRGGDIQKERKREMMTKESSIWKKNFHELFNSLFVCSPFISQSSLFLLSSPRCYTLWQLYCSCWELLNVCVCVCVCACSCVCVSILVLVWSSGRLQCVYAV